VLRSSQLNARLPKRVLTIAPSTKHASRIAAIVSAWPNHIGTSKSRATNSATGAVLPPIHAPSHNNRFAKTNNGKTTSTPPISVVRM